MKIESDIWQVNAYSYIREMDVIFTENSCDASKISSAQPAYVQLNAGEFNYQKPIIPSLFINKLNSTFDNVERSNSIVFKLTPEVSTLEQGPLKFWKKYPGNSCDLTLNGVESFAAISVAKTNKSVPLILRTDNQIFYVGD